MGDGPSEVEQWLLDDFDLPVGMVKQRLEAANTVEQVQNVRNNAPQLLARFRKMFGPALAAEADARMAAAQAQIDELADQRIRSLKKDDAR